MTGALRYTWVQVELTLIDCKDENRAGSKIWRADIKHEGCLKIEVGSNRLPKLIDEKDRNCP